MNYSIFRDSGYLSERMISLQLDSAYENNYVYFYKYYLNFFYIIGTRLEYSRFSSNVRLLSLFSSLGLLGDHVLVYQRAPLLPFNSITDTLIAVLFIHMQVVVRSLPCTVYTARSSPA